MDSWWAPERCLGTPGLVRRAPSEAGLGETDQTAFCGWGPQSLVGRTALAQGTTVSARHRGVRAARGAVRGWLALCPGSRGGGRGVGDEREEVPPFSGREGGRSANSSLVRLTAAVPGTIVEGFLQLCQGFIESKSSHTPLHPLWVRRAARCVFHSDGRNAELRACLSLPEWPDPRRTAGRSVSISGGVRGSWMMYIRDVGQIAGDRRGGMQTRNLLS